MEQTNSPEYLRTVSPTHGHISQSYDGSRPPIGHDQAAGAVRMSANECSNVEAAITETKRTWGAAWFSAMQRQHDLR